MDSNEQSLSVTLTRTAFDWVTATHFVVIVLLAIGAIAILIWGRHLRRMRREADAEVVENNENCEGDGHPPEP